MRTDRERAGWPTVEFVDEDTESSAGEAMTLAAGPAPRRVLMAAGFVAAIVAFAVVGQISDSPTAARKPHAPVRTSSSPPRPAPPQPPQAHVVEFAEWPSAAITEAFAADIPGAVVISEHTSLTNRGRELRLRAIRAVSGNVVLDVVVGRPTNRRPSHATRIMQGSYAVTIKSTGYYAPTRKQLRRLAEDRRLTAVF